jgi:hypothetical protein
MKHKKITADVFSSVSRHYDTFFEPYNLSKDQGLAEDHVERS